MNHYGVNDWNDPLTIEALPVKKVTAKQVVLGRSGKVSDFRTTLTREEFCATPEEAVSRYARLAEEKASKLVGEANELRAKARAARCILTPLANPVPNSRGHDPCDGAI